MKKIIFPLGIISLLLFVACQRGTGEMVSDDVGNEGADSSVEASEPSSEPSKDSMLYAEATSNRSLEKCAQISRADLKQSCTELVQKSLESETSVNHDVD